MMAINFINVGENISAIGGMSECNNVTKISSHAEKNIKTKNSLFKKIIGVGHSTGIIFKIRFLKVCLTSFAV